MNFQLVRKVVLYSVLAGVIFTSGYFLGTRGFRLETGSFPKITINRTLPEDHRDVDFALFWRVWDTLDSSYYDKSKITPAKMVYGAISGMVASLGDPYTAFLPPEENKVIEEDLSGSFEGVGVQIGFKGKNLAVVAPLPGSPAEKSGIKAGDFIVGIADQAKKIETSTSGMNLNDAVKIIRGKAGTKISLLILRDGSNEPMKIEVTREKVDVPSVITEFIGTNKDIAHIRLLKFGADTNKEWNDSVNKVIGNNPKVKGIILDLRNNPGGYLQGSVDIAGEFLKKDSVVVIEDKGEEKTEFKTTRLGRLQDFKMVILVNGGSASASEILSGALSETKGYKLIGETTFGKGTIQEPLQLEKGAGLHITTAKWLTPKGNWVHEKGIEPNIKVEDNPQTTEDEQLQKALQEIVN